MPTNFIKLFKQLKPSDRPPSLSLRRQVIGYKISIVSAIASVLVGVASFILALSIKDHSVTIDKMDSLVTLIAKQDTSLIRLIKQNDKSIADPDTVVFQLKR